MLLVCSRFLFPEEESEVLPGLTRVGLRLPFLALGQMVHQEASNARMWALEEAPIQVAIPQNPV